MRRRTRNCNRIYGLRPRLKPTTALWRFDRLKRQRPMDQKLDATMASYRTNHATLEHTDLSKDPGWTRDLRAAALGSFLSTGFPTARRGNEEWKYTNVEPISSIVFQYPDGNLNPKSKDLNSFNLQESNSTRLVFLNGSFSDRFSSPSLANVGISVSSLANSLQSQTTMLQKYLGQLADYSTESFTALNTAFLHDGALVHLAEGSKQDTPIPVSYTHLTLTKILLE